MQTYPAYFAPAPIRVTSPNLENVHFKKIALGSNHFIALSTDGRVFTWGYNQKGQLSLGGDPNQFQMAYHTGPQVPGEIAVDIVGGVESSCALTSNSKIYCWGSNQYGILTDPQVMYPFDYRVQWTEIDMGEMVGKTVKKISMNPSGVHMMALTTDGKVYAWGRNDSHALGQPSITINEQVQFSPLRVSGGHLMDKVVTDISAGVGVSLAIAEGKIYRWGNNAYNAPNAAPFLEETGDIVGKTIVQVSAGYEQTMALDSDGNVYVWGNNSYGQTGNGIIDTSFMTVNPTKISEY